MLDLQNIQTEREHVKDRRGEGKELLGVRGASSLGEGIKNYSQTGLINCNNASLLLSMMVFSFNPHYLYYI